jgi:hypothetical protein
MGGLSFVDWPSFDFDGERETVRDFDAPDFPLTQVRDGFQKVYHLFLEPEIRQRGFRTRSVVAAHFQLLDDLRGVGKVWLPGGHELIFDAGKRLLLKQFYKPTLSVGKRGFRNLLLVHSGTPFLKSKELPDADGRVIATSCCSSRSQPNAGATA